MAVLLLLSTVSWTVDKHLCMGRVMDVSLFTKAQDCGMDAAMALLEDVDAENHCCDNEAFTITGQEDLKLSFNDISIGEQLVMVAFAYSFSNLFHIQEEVKLNLNEYYPPPKLIKNIQLLDEVFLI